MQEGYRTVRTFAYVKLCFFFLFSQLLNLSTDVVSKNSTPSVLKVHRKEDDLKIIVAFAGVAMIVDSSISCAQGFNLTESVYMCNRC